MSQQPTTADTAQALPGHPFVAYHGFELQVEDVRLSQLTAEHGTPLFVYSKASMLAALAATNAASPAARRKFATP